MNELTIFILTGVIYIIMQDRAAILNHLSKFGESYQRVWYWIRDNSLNIIRDEEQYEDAWATHTLIFLCVAAYVAALAFGYDESLQINAFIPALASEMWRWVTHIFMHASFPVELAPFSLHILGNMAYLYWFGDNVEQRLNRFRYEVLGTQLNIYAALFIVWGAIAAATQATIIGWGSQTLMVGASGAISGVLGFYLIMFPQNNVYVGGRGPIKAIYFLAAWFIMQVAYSMDAGYVAYGAHAGGFAAGAATALALKKIEDEP